MAEKRDYYDVLGVDKDADARDIKRAYRRLSKKYHPDINKAEDAEDKFKEITEAYEVLSDDQKRAAYDQYGHAGVDSSYGGGAGHGAGGFGGFGDFGGSSSFGGFEDIFSDLFGGGRSRRDPSAPTRGSDLQYQMNLSFEEAIFGKETDVTYDRKETCETCSGSGAKPGTQPETCPRCHGSGAINVENNTPFGRMMTQTTCPECHGKGQIVKDPCPDCHGIGTRVKSHKVRVTVPAGVEEGNQIRLQGQGNVGDNNGPYGDLYVVFYVEPSDTFERHGSEIYYELPINFVQASLGDEIEVPTVYGRVKFKIPAGTQPGTTFRLKGKGAPHLRTGGTGDQHIEVKIQVPKKLNDEQKETLREFAKVSGYDEVSEHSGSFFSKVKDAFKK